MAQVLILSGREVQAHLKLSDAIARVEQAFADLHRGESRLFPTVREQIPAYDGIFGIKSGHLQAEGVMGLKAGGFWLGNAARDLTNHQSTMLLFDPATGAPVCLLDANYLTSVRTGAAAAVAAKHLARADAAVLGVIGAGVQAYMQIQGILQVRPVREIYLWDVRPEAARRLADRLSGETGLRVEAAGAPEVCGRADILVTMTPSTRPVLERAWVRPGTHVNAMGADTKGKQELDTAILTDPATRLVVDDLEQCRVLGESQHIPGGPDRYVYATLGQIAAGEKPGRTDDTQVTVFDGTGVAVQDLAVAGLLYRQALEQGLGRLVEL